MEPIIKGKNLTVTYNPGKANEFRALKGVNVEIYPEEFVILFGPSGCGKSTLLYSFLGVLPYNEGSLLINDRDPYKMTTEELVQFQQKTMGIVYQAFYLIPSLTVMDNVSLPLIFAGTEFQKRKKRTEDLLQRFGVFEQKDKIPASLSGGQQQRIAVARALVNDPDILLADEPVGNLDSVSKGAVMDAFSDINTKDKKTVIMVTHDAKHLHYAHRVYRMKDGEVVREVINPLKPQLKPIDESEMIYTEVDKLSRVYPYDTPEELRVKSIVNYLTQEIDFEQIERLEKLIKFLLEGKIEKESLISSLSASFNDGGVGLHQKTAETMADKAVGLVEYSRDIARYRREMKNIVSETDEKMSTKKDIAKRLRSHLLEEGGDDLDRTQHMRLDELINLRIAGGLAKDSFQNKLSLSVEKGGIGLNHWVARSLTVYFEKLLAQGMSEEQAR